MFKAIHNVHKRGGVMFFRFSTLFFTLHTLTFAREKFHTLIMYALSVIHFKIIIYLQIRQLKSKKFPC
jgi:hypothetical protein